MIDHDQPRADGFDVLQIMGGEDDGDAALAVDLGEKTPHGILGDHIKSDGRLVQKEDLGVVQQRHHDLGAHALTEAELANRAVEKGRQIKQLAEASEIIRIAGGGNAVDALMQGKTVDQRQVPPQLAALAENDADLAGIVHPPQVWGPAEDRERAVARHQSAGHHLDHRRFAGAIRAEIANGFAGRDVETDVGNGQNFRIFVGHQRLQGAQQARKSLVLPEAFADAPRLDQSRHVYFLKG